MSSSVIISTASGLTTLLVSILVTTLKNKSDFKKFKQEIEHNYAKSLFNKRIEIYPKLFHLTSVLNKLIEYSKQDYNDLIKFQKDIDSWNSENAIFLTSTSSRIAYGYRFYLKDILENHNNKEIDMSIWKNIRTLNVAFEKSLRAEIGIYDTDPAGKLINTKELEKIYGSIIKSTHDKLNSFN